MLLYAACVLLLCRGPSGLVVTASSPSWSQSFVADSMASLSITNSVKEVVRQQFVVTCSDVIRLDCPSKREIISAPYL